MKKLLYVDSCVNRETSRTERLAQALIRRLLEENDLELETIVLEDESLRPLTGPQILERDAATKAEAFDGPLFRYAQQFATADLIVFAAPYWDFSFPSMFKVYLEYLCAQGVTFNYSDDGVPTTLMHATKAFYVTTSGGYVGDLDFGFAQVRALCQAFFGIEDVRAFRAEGLDIITNDAETIMAEALERIAQAEL